MIAAILATRSTSAPLSPIASSITGHATVSGFILQGHSVTLTWSAAQDQVDGYFVYRGSTSGGESGTPLNATIIPYGTNTYTDVNPMLGPNYYIVLSSLDGVLSQIANEVNVTIGEVASINGHASVAGTLKATGKLAAAISGHASVKATPPNIGLLISSITGHASVSANLKATGALTGSIAGHASVSGKPSSIVQRTAVISGHAAVSGVIKANGFLASHITGHASVSGSTPGIGSLEASIKGQASIFSVLGGVGSLISAVRGHAAVSGTLSSSAIITPISAGVAGHASISGLLAGLNARPIFESFGVSSANPAIINFTQSAQIDFTRPAVAPGNIYPVTALPQAASQLGWEALPNQLLVLPSYAWLRSHPVTVLAAGYAIAPRQSTGTFNIQLAQNYFLQTGSTPSSIEIFSDPLAVAPANVTLAQNTTVSWNLTARMTAAGKGVISCGFTLTLNGQIFSGGFSSNRFRQFHKIVQPVELSLAAIFSGPIFGTDSCQIGLTQFDINV